MSFEQFVFYAISLILLVSGLMVVTVKNPVKAALFLVLCFFSGAALWLLLEAEFLALSLVLVYVGAVMVLFLFVVMMLDINIAEMREGFTDYLPIGGIVAVLMVLELGMILTSKKTGLGAASHPVVHGADYSNTAEIGKVLYTDYVYPFEIASVLLVVAIVAAIALTMRKRPETKKQTPSRQIAVKARDRLRMVDLKSERK